MSDETTCIPDNPCAHYRAAVGATVAGERYRIDQQHRDLAAAIATIEASRQTHVEWRDYLRRNPSYDPGPVGGADYHDRAVREYDHVLSVIRQLATHGDCVALAPADTPEAHRG